MLNRICSLRVLKFLGLAVGLAAKFTTGSIFIFNAYQDAIKHTFNYTQIEVELLSSMLNVGLGVGFLPGMFYDRFGPTLASTAGLAVSVPVYLLLWSTPRYAQFYSTRAWLLSIYFMLAGLGSVFTYTVALNTNIINFSAKHTGKIVGLLNAFFAGSPSVYGTIYYKLFTTGDPTEPSNQDFGGFMMFFAIMFGIVNFLCVVLLRNYTEKGMQNNATSQNVGESSGVSEGGKANDLSEGKDELSNEINDIKESNGQLTRENVENGGFEQNGDNRVLSFRETFFNIDYQTFTWMFAFASSVGLVYGNNITVTSKSVGLDYYNDKLVIIIPITNAIVSASIGVLSDWFKERIPRLVIAAFGASCFILAQLVVMFLADVLIWLIIATVLTGVGVGIIWSICPTIMKEIFSVEHLGRNWGIALFLAAVVGFASQIVFGRLYDSHITDEEENYCYGKICVVSGYGVFLGMASIAFALGVFMLLRRRCCQTKNSLQTQTFTR